MIENSESFLSEPRSAYGNTDDFRVEYFYLLNELKTKYMGTW